MLGIAFVIVCAGGAPDDRKEAGASRHEHKYDSSVTATPCYQLMGSNDGDVSTRWVNREKYIQIACPYGFKYSYLLDIYRRAEEAHLLEKIEPHTTSLMYALGDKIYQAYGDQTNIKITTKEDFDMFEGYILMRKRRANQGLYQIEI